MDACIDTSEIIIDVTDVRIGVYIQKFICYKALYEFLIHLNTIAQTETSDRPVFMGINLTAQRF